MPYHTHSQAVVLQTQSIGQGSIRLRSYVNQVLLLTSASMNHLPPPPPPPTPLLHIRLRLLCHNSSAATAVALKVSELLLLQSAIVRLRPQRPPCMSVNYPLAMDTLWLCSLWQLANISNNEPSLDARPTDWMPE